MTYRKLLTLTEVHAEKLLSPTAINGVSHVINPYKGCPIGCLYCYTRSNKNIKKRTETWGTFCDVKVNSAQLLKSELADKTPTRILLGSTCECYNPLEVTYRLTRSLLTVLNEHGSSVTILTRSPLINRDVFLLGELADSHVYFTLNHVSECLVKHLQRSTYSLPSQLHAIKALLASGINVTAYISPYFHQHTLVKRLLKKLYETVGPHPNLSVAIEVYNIQAGNWSSVKPMLKKNAPALYNMLQNIYEHEDAYEKSKMKIRAYIKEWTHAYPWQITLYAPDWNVFYSQMRAYTYTEQMKNQSNNE